MAHTSVAKEKFKQNFPQHFFTKTYSIFRNIQSFNKRNMRKRKYLIDIIRS